MKFSEIISALKLEIKSGSASLEREVSGGYVSDMLSDVMAHAVQGNVWVTLQIHLNIVAVASLVDLAGIIIVNGRVPEDDTLKKANQEQIPIAITDLQAFEVVGKLYQLGIGGTNENV